MIVVNSAVIVTRFAKVAGNFAMIVPSFVKVADK